MFNFNFNLKSIDEEVIIFLIDDDEFISKILRTKFETSTDYKVFAFSSGEEFLEYIIKNKVPKVSLPIVVLDYSLKTHTNYDAKDGIEILKITKELYPDFEVIMISSFEDIDIATTSMRYGATSFIKKNENSFTRIQNTIKYTISRKKLERTKKQSQLTRKFFIILIITLVVILLFFFKELFLK